MRPRSQVLSRDRQTGIQSKILSHVYLVASLSLVSCSERMCTSQKGNWVRKSWCLSRDKLCCGKTPQNAALEISLYQEVLSLCYLPRHALFTIFWTEKQTEVKELESQNGMSYQKRQEFISDELINSNNWFSKREKEQKEKAWLGAFANFCVLNILNMVDFKMPTLYHWSRNWKRMCSNISLDSISTTQAQQTEVTSKTHTPVCVCQLLSRVWLFETPWTVTGPAPLSMEISRQEY